MHKTSAAEQVQGKTIKQVTNFSCKKQKLNIESLKN
jgi:hypothetical protein